MKFYELITSVQTKNNLNAIDAKDFRNKYFKIIVEAIINGVK